MGRHETFGAKFKVGDRVRPVEDEKEQIVSHWNQYWAKGEGKYEGVLFVTTTPSFGSFSYSTTPLGDGPIDNEAWFEPAPLYAVGDKVRALVGWIDVTQGNEYKVVEVDEDAEGVCIIDDIGDKGFMHNYEVELVQQPAAPKFKVGDKIRVIKGGEEIGGSCHGGAIGDELIISNVGETAVTAGRWAYYFHEVELVAVAPATATADSGMNLGDILAAAMAKNTLTIQAGRYYTTRDGRKVGPMVRRDDATHPWVADFKNDTSDPYVLIFKDDGKNYMLRHLDLIAEWPAEHVVAKATTADDDFFDDGGPYNEPEPNSRLLLTITADTSALDAEIDRVKRSLKKLEKRARKLGINLEFSDLRDAA